MVENNFEEELGKEMQIACPKCREPMHMTARRCPACRYDFSDDEVRENIASKKVNRTGCFAILGVGAMITLVGFSLWPSNGGSDDAKVAVDAGAMTAEKEYTYKETAMQVISERLRDPESAVFSNMTVYPETEDRATIICGNVNSRNGFGGMTGPQRFIAGGTVMLEEQFTKAQMSNAWTKFCN